MAARSEQQPLWTFGPFWRSKQPAYPMRMDQFGLESIAEVAPETNIVNAGQAERIIRMDHWAFHAALLGGKEVTWDQVPGDIGERDLLLGEKLTINGELLQKNVFAHLSRVDGNPAVFLESLPADSLTQARLDVVREGTRAPVGYYEAQADGVHFYLPDRRKQGGFIEAPYLVEGPIALLPRQYGMLSLRTPADMANELESTTMELTISQSGLAMPKMNGVAQRYSVQGRSPGEQYPRGSIKRSFQMQFDRSNGDL